MRVNFLATVALLLPLVLSGCHSKPAADARKDAPKPTVQLMPVTRGDLERILPASGTLQTLPGKEALLTPPVAGVLDSVFVHFGQSVVIGQVIARLSTRQLQGQVQQAQATVGLNLVQVQQAEANALQQQAQTRTTILQAQAGVRSAQAALAGALATLTGSEASVQNARQTLSRQQTLLADGLVPQKDVEAAQLALRTAEAQREAQKQTVDGQRQTVAGQQQVVLAARAASIQNLVKQKDIQVANQQVRNAQGALATAQAQIALYTLHAPLSGQVTLVGATVGQTVDTTTKVAAIADLTNLQIQINIPTDTASQVHGGEKVTLKIGGSPGRTLRAVIERVGSQVDAATGTVPAFAVVANPDKRLKDNTTAQARIVTEARQHVLLVPQSALLTDPDTGRKNVVVVGTDSVAHVVPVTVGLTADGRAEVLSGVTEGQKVAVSGQYGLPDGAAVTVQNLPASGSDGGTHGP